MYQQYMNKLAAKRRESFPLIWIAGENIIYIGQWAIATALVWPIRWYNWPIVSILWVAVVITIQVLLKKHNCTGCYYYGKRCHLGWGLLAKMLFKQNSGNIQTGMQLSLFYIITPPLFLISALLIGFFFKVGIAYWILLGFYVVLNATVFPIRKKGCRLCAMREVCFGSAAKSIAG